MRTDIAGWLALVVVGLAAGRAVAQPERYELGQRLKRFEQAWEETKDPAARKRALAIVKKASGQFLSLQLGEAGRTLDEARWALQGRTPTDTERWLESLYTAPEKRLLDSATSELPVEVRAFYTVKPIPPLRTSVLLRIGQGLPATVPVAKLPAKVAVKFPPGRSQADQYLTLEASHDGKLIGVRNIGVSTVRDLAARLSWLEQSIKATARIPTTASDWLDIELATMSDSAEGLTALASGQVFEIDPAANATFDMIWFGSLLSIGGRRHYIAPTFMTAFTGKSMNYRLVVPTDKGQTTVCRFHEPRGLSQKYPVPLVVALHGAGGSENLFFEGYGNGHIVKECEKRGWMLLAPRGGLLGAAPVAAIIDKLAERYPIDPKRIFLVGHSMGAGQAIELAQQHPGKFAAVASLGGAGRVRKKEPFADLPVFVGVGDQDFALKGSRALHKALTDAGAKRVTYKEYPDLEHLVIVREALPDVFALWDEIAKK